MRFSSISAIGTLSALNGSATDSLYLIPSRCTDSRSLRTSVEDAPGSDGVLVFPPLEGARIITLSGDLIIGSAGDESGYMSAIDTLTGTIDTALDALKTAAGSLVHGGGSFNVWLYAPPVYSWSGVVQSVTFALVAA